MGNFEAVKVIIDLGIIVFWCQKGNMISFIKLEIAIALKCCVKLVQTAYHYFYMNLHKLR